MPLPDAAEEAAAQIEEIGQRLDRAIAEFLENGGTLPALGTLLALIEPKVRTAVIAAAAEVVNPTAAQIEAAVAEAMGPIEEALTATLSKAQRARRTVPRATPDDPDTENVPTLKARLSAGAVFAVLVARLTARRKRVPGEVIQVARNAGLAAPRQTASYMRMVVRTEAARGRNTMAVDLARAEGLAIYVLDGRNGPTDHECERVNGRWASVTWARRHPLEHPNCTRKFIPRPLPSSQRITLIS